MTISNASWSLYGRLYNKDKTLKIMENIDLLPNLIKKLVFMSLTKLPIPKMKKNAMKEVKIRCQAMMQEA